MSFLGDVTIARVESSTDQAAATANVPSAKLVTAVGAEKPSPTATSIATGLSVPPRGARKASRFASFENWPTSKSSAPGSGEPSPFISRA